MGDEKNVDELELYNCPRTSSLIYKIYIVCRIVQTTACRSNNSFNTILSIFKYLIPYRCLLLLELIILSGVDQPPMVNETRKKTVSHMNY